MKIVITIESTADGGAYIEMNPGAAELVNEVDAGKGTTAHGCALHAYTAIYEWSRGAAANGGRMDAGEVPPHAH